MKNIAYFYEFYGLYTVKHNFGVTLFSTSYLLVFDSVNIQNTKIVIVGSIFIINNYIYYLKPKQIIVGSMLMYRQVVFKTCQFSVYILNVY